MPQTKMRKGANTNWLNLISAAAAGNSGQILIEYILMFTVIVVVIIFAATHYIQPSVNHLFKETGDVINNIADDFVANAYRWNP